MKVWPILLDRRGGTSLSRVEAAPGVPTNTGSSRTWGVVVCIHHGSCRSSEHGAGCRKDDIRRQGGSRRPGT
jgi:hypothetical protein